MSSRRSRRELAQAGAITIEYLVILVVVTALLVALIKVGTAYFSKWVEDVSKCLVDQECGAGEPEPVGPAPTPLQEAPVTCTTATRELTSSLTTDTIFRRDVQGKRYAVRERSDGALEILDTESKGRGNSVFGGGAVRLGKERVGLGATAARLRVQEHGDVYVLESEQDKEAYKELLRHEAVEKYVNGIASAGNRDGEHARQLARLTLMDRTYTRVAEGVEVNVSGGARYVRGGVGISGEGATIIEEDLKTEETTVTFEIGGEAAADLGVILLGGPSGMTEGTYSTSVTIAADGTPTKLAVVTETGVTAGTNLSLDPAAVVDLPSFLNAAAGIGSTDESGSTARITTEVDLKDDDSRAAAMAFVDRPGARTAAGLADKFRRSGNALVEVLDKEASTTTYGASISLLGSLGFEGEDSVSTSALRDAWSWRPRAGLVHETECLR